MKNTFNSIGRHGFWIPLVLVTSLICSCASNELAEKTPEQKKAEIYYGQGTNELVKKNYAQALINLLKAREFDPKDSLIRNNLGMAYYLREQPALAEKEFVAAIELDKKNSDAKVNLGALYMGQNKNNEARKLFEEVLNDLTYVGQFRNFYNLAILALKIGDRAEAFEYLFKSIKEKEDYCQAHYKLGELYAEEDKFQHAFNSFTESSKGLCVNEPAPHYQQGLALLKLGRFEEARSKFKYIAEKFPKTSFSNMSALQLKKISSQIKQQSLTRNYQTEVITDSKIIETPNF